MTEALRVRVRRARLMRRHGRTRINLVAYIVGGMDRDYVRDWWQAAHDWALEMLVSPR